MKNAARAKRQEVCRYPEQLEMESRIINLIHEYDGQMSVGSVVGILDSVKDTIKLDSE